MTLLLGEVPEARHPFPPRRRSGKRDVKTAQPQTGHGALPRCAYSFAAMRSCSASDAAAGSPLPPRSAHVSRENWYLPRYVPLAETAVGSPPDSHCAILASVALGAPDVPALLGAEGAAAPEMPIALIVAGPATPSTARPWLRWNVR